MFPKKLDFYGVEKSAPFLYDKIEVKNSPKRV